MHIRRREVRQLSRPALKECSASVQAIDVFFAHPSHDRLSRLRALSLDLSHVTIPPIRFLRPEFRRRLLSQSSEQARAQPQELSLAIARVHPPRYLLHP